MEIVAVSETIKEAMSVAAELARTDITVLITGETGTGKEIFAKFIHENGKRAKKPFIAINCGAISQSILESELFGHERGAFTGAITMRRGYFESANEGSIFLDEVGEMPLDTQVKFLRTLESGAFQRVGSSEMLRTNARIIAATNRSLEQAVTQKKFRGDLYFRLRVATIWLPPLRERREDILILAEKFVREFEQKYQVTFSGFTSDATRELLDYRYPGNIRELRNLIEILVALEHKHVITPEKITKHLANPLLFAPTIIEPSTTTQSHDAQWHTFHDRLVAIQADIHDIKTQLASSPTPLPLPPHLAPHKQTHEHGTSSDMLSLREMEKHTIQKVLSLTKGNKRQASLKLGIAERTLYRKMNEYGIPDVHKKQHPTS